ncbi:metallophosphoesterase family protein [Nocardia terpenica]|uniref:purple acid phosphatase family protein n=1 Tax=Nocardia terpenica TaxID=455432 RepID=UPI0018936A3E|nr:metallophosphoesterase family protein [Nocardia terpenica]MBF6064544.1 metallophosphoesterase family protein [Nocardia terpenica]MBF6106832.1 metallophosphoesterase family protein [Nocardia terpenica]MBF6114512.1 metallophosphoesterase family protein [Nocardia terpenica]MBF6121402.1 metallophosphoesterase family protein [Nocardia terpenica]MBF6153817.1 metallophosphoesterase family protein [Nocardia terpenica]
MSEREDSSSDPVTGADQADTAQRGVSRRWLFGASAGAAVAGLAVGAGGATALRSSSGGSEVWQRSAELVVGADRGAGPRVSGLHLQFGADAAREAVVSWHTVGSVSKPMVRFGTAGNGFGSTVQAETRTYQDAKSGIEIQVHHARLTGLTPDTDYVYSAGHDGAPPELGTLRTAPAGRAAFRFTSFGDQGTPTLGKLDNGKWVNDNLGSPFAGDVTAGVERVAPLFNLVNGDLCYANLSNDRIRTWNDWWANNSRSARYRPWMPAPGNHENELGNGPIGYQAFQTYFTVPDSGGEDLSRGLWYSFTVGGMRVIALANDDICYQDAGNSYVRGYSGGAQKRWLEAELAKARADRGIDWVVVFMHQTAISSADKFNGADLAIRQEWLPLFDRYQVDLVLCGHEHHYERSHPVRGALGTDTLTPNPVDTRTDVIDTSRGTVHLVIGGGGTSLPSNTLFFPGKQCRVITGVGDVDPGTGKKTPVYVREQAPWSAFADAEHPYGFCSFDVDPGHPGGNTTIKATYYALVGPTSELKVVDSFTLTRPRADR